MFNNRIFEFIFLNQNHKQKNCFFDTYNEPKLDEYYIQQNLFFIEGLTNNHNRLNV